MSNDEPATFTVGMATTILEKDPNPLRFEKWCLDVFSKVDGVDYLPTSRSYDEARDGRAANHRARERPRFLLCTIGEKLTRKVKDDLRTLLKKAQPSVIRVCTTRPVSETESEALKDVVRAECKSLEAVYVDGLEQMAVLARRYPSAFQAHYGSELRVLRNALSYEGTDESSVQLSAMRLALSTQLSGDAGSLRQRTLRNLVLDAAAARPGITRSQLPHYVREHLHLSAPVASSYLSAAIEDERRSGNIDDADGSLTLTSEGRVSIETRNQRGGREVLEGRSMIRAELERLTGEELPDDRFEVIWQQLEEGISHLFMTNGLQVIRSVSSLLDASIDDGPDESLGSLIEELADRIEVKLAAWPPGECFAQAVRDIFVDKSSPAFDWLAGLATVYLTICSLGLEASAQEQLENRLRHIHLLLDTDVVLSYLCQAEPTHGGVRDIVTAWRRLRGKLYVTESVLTEAAYHAWIADIEFEETWTSLESIDDHLLHTAFVRTFKRLADGRVSPKRWRQYIRGFKGDRARDSQPIWEVLRDEAKCEIASEEAGDTELAKGVEERLIAAKERKLYARAEYGREVHEKERDKCRRDGRLIGYLTRQRELQRKSSSDTTIVVSNSSSLRWVCNLYREQLGRPAPVLSVSSMAYLLSLAPGVSITVGGLRGLLFDPGVRETLSAWETRALRALCISDEYEAAWSTRPRLRREIDAAIVGYAERRGQRPKDFREAMEADTEEGRELSANVLAGALDNIAGSRSERRIAELQQALRRRGG